MSWKGWLIPRILLTKHRSHLGPNQPKIRTHEQHTTKMLQQIDQGKYDFPVLHFDMKFILITSTLKHVTCLTD